MRSIKKILRKESALLGIIIIILNLTLLFNTNLMKINFDVNDDKYSYHGQTLTLASISNYNFYKNITILSSQVTGSGSHSNFPVLISLTDTDLRDQCQSDGDDIAFYGGTSRLDYEIEYFDKSTGKLVVWVRIPSLSTSTDTIVRMYFGNPTLVSSEANPSGVWINDFQGVWHLGEPSGSISYDSTSNGFLGTHLGGPTSQEGKIGNAYYFDGNDDIIEISANAFDLGIDGNKHRTISSWVKITEQPVTHTGVFYYGNDVASQGFCLVKRLYTPEEWSLATWSGDIQLNVPNSIGNWIYFSCVYNGTTLFAYVNGYLEGTSNINLNTSNNDPFTIGQYKRLIGTCFQGLIDDIRCSNTFRSAEWIATEYTNQNDPSSFYTVGNSRSNPDYNPTLPANPSNMMSFSIIIIIIIGAFVTTGIVGSFKFASKAKYTPKKKKDPYWMKNYVKANGNKPVPSTYTDTSFISDFNENSKKRRDKYNR